MARQVRLEKKGNRYAVVRQITGSDYAEIVSTHKVLRQAQKTANEKMRAEGVAYYIHITDKKTGERILNV